MNDEGQKGIEIPAERLSDEILKAVIEEFVLREGTDYGHQDVTLEQKVAQVRKQLNTGKAKIYFDPVSESCTLVVSGSLSR